jgi:pimeloyl-ACP methyl ester carboxylesterase
MKHANAPTVLLVHGSWAGAWVWDSVIPELTGRGIPSLAVDLPGCSQDRQTGWGISLGDYVGAIVSEAERMHGRLVLIGHSAGGFPVSQAASDRPDLFSALVYLAAYLPVNGERLSKLSGKDPVRSVTASVKLHLWRGTSTQPPEAMAAMLYHDCSPGTATLLAERHRPEPLPVSINKVRLGPEFERLPKYYVQCTRDRVISPEFQKSMADRYELRAFHQLDTGHVPMVDAPSTLADRIRTIAEDVSVH